MSEAAIRPAEAADLELLAGWLSRPEVNRWLGSHWRGGVVDPRRLLYALKDKSNRFFTMLRDGEPCGLVALSELDLADRFGMVWYLLGEARFQGHGLTTNAVRLVVSHAFGELELRCLYAWVHPDNHASIRLLNKVGFRLVGRFRDATVMDGVRADRVLFDLTVADWEAGSQA